MAEKGIHTPEFEKKIRKKRNLKLTLAITITVALVALPILLSRLSRFHIVNIEMSGNTVTSNDAIAQIVDRELEGNYLWIFPHKNALLYPKGEIAADLMKEIPRLKSVDIDLVDAHSIKITVTERTPYALYCEDITNILMPDKCYFLDDTGFIFSEAPSFSGDVYFIYASSEPIQEPLGKEFLPKETFAQLPDYIQSLEGFGVHGRAIIVEGDDYHLVLPNSGEIIWRRSDEPSLIRDNLEAFIKETTSKDENFLNKILYIDLRFENKVFYKFQNE